VIKDESLSQLQLLAFPFALFKFSTTTTPHPYAKRIDIVSMYRPRRDDNVPEEDRFMGGNGTLPHSNYTRIHVCYVLRDLVKHQLQI